MHLNTNDPVVSGNGFEHTDKQTSTIADENLSNVNYARMFTGMFTFNSLNSGISSLTLTLYPRCYSNRPLPWVNLGTKYKKI